MLPSIQESSSDYRARVWLDEFYSWVKILVDVVQGSVIIFEGVY